MPNVTFPLLGQNINLDPTQLLDLGQADQDLHLITQEIVNLRALLHALQDGKLVSLALNGVAPKWSNLAGSPATFSLTPTASFTITLQSSYRLIGSGIPRWKNLAAGLRCDGTRNVIERAKGDHLRFYGGT